MRRQGRYLLGASSCYLCVFAANMSPPTSSTKFPFLDIKLLPKLSVMPVEYKKQQQQAQETASPTCCSLPANCYVCTATTPTNSCATGPATVSLLCPSFFECQRAHTSPSLQEAARNRNATLIYLRRNNNNARAPRVLAHRLCSRVSGVVNPPPHCCFS
jgi:hypothetical protein